MDMDFGESQWSQKGVKTNELEFPARYIVGVVRECDEPHTYS